MPQYLFNNSDIQYLLDGIAKSDGLNFGVYERSLWQKVSGKFTASLIAMFLRLKDFNATMVNYFSENFRNLILKYPPNFNSILELKLRELNAD